MAPEKIKRRVEELCKRGDQLYLRLILEESPTAFDDKPKTIAALEKLPAFAEGYQVWYTEALELLRQTFPSRVEDFTSFLNPPKTRKEITFANYTISDALRGLKVTRGYQKDLVVDASAAINPMLQQVKIIESVKDGLDSVLVNLRSVLQADLFDSDLGAARELNKKGFARAAGMMAGVVLEGHLKEVCQRHHIKVAAKSPTISTYNEALKDAGVVDVPLWRRVQAAGDIRNQCGHKTGKEPSKEDVERLIGDVDDLIKRIS